jgi:cystathionine beta-lyase
MSQTLTPAQLKLWLFDGQEIALFDVREHGQYGEAHLFHGVNLPYSRLEIEAPRLAPNPRVRLVVYDQDGGALAHRAVARLAAFGYCNAWVLASGADGWKAEGNELFAGVHLPSKAFGEIVEHACHTPRVTAPQLLAWQQQAQPPLVLDGRPLEEFRKMSIPGAVCCPNGELSLRLEDLVADEHMPIVINCAGRTRSIIGAQTLLNLGVKNPVYALENGTQGWFLADQTLDHGNHAHYPPRLNQPATAEQLKRATDLARRTGVIRVAAEQVRQWAQDPGRSLFLGDVRTPEEFAAGTLPGAQHTPGGQLIQGTDLYIGVRKARVVLFDDDGVRAPVVASWLRQLGHEAYVLEGGLESGLALAAPAPLGVDLLTATQADLDSALIVDLRSSTSYRKRHVAGSQWSIRPLLAEQVRDEQRPLVLVVDEPAVAQLAVMELPADQRASVHVLVDWQGSGLSLADGGAALRDEQCIDFLFFVHDRHAGNKEAARQYLVWETGLIAQMTEQEIGSFAPLVIAEPLRTRLIHGGRGPRSTGAHGVSPPLVRLSTVLFDNLAQMRDARARRDQQRVLSYGARGNPTAFALEDLITDLEGGYRTKLFATGLAAAAQMFLAYLRPGDHVLITDGVYGPVRRLARDFLQPFGIEVDYFRADGSGLEQAFKANTRMVYAESPSSLLYEMLDLPAIAVLCKPRNVLLAVDNTWGSGYLYRPLALGADISIMALTKYVAGHSDVMMGSVCTTEAAFSALSRMSDTFGNTVSPDDAWLVLRGARTLASRLEVHERQGLEIAQWLLTRAEVARVFHPALPEHPGHGLWRRDYSGSNGLLSFEFAHPASNVAETFVDALQVFGLGASWGGYESLVTLGEIADRHFSVDVKGGVVRLHIGLEDVDSLKADLQRGFAIAAGVSDMQ